jgi:hypothetical protein
MPRITIDNALLQQLVAEMDRSLTLGDLGVLVGDLGDDIANIAPEGTKRARMQKVALTAHARGWLAELADFIIGDEQRFGANLVGVCQGVKAQWEQRRKAAAAQAPDDPKSALVLANGAPFVDREDTRPLIDRLVRDQAPRVMVVRGEAASGKSHLAMFVAHLLEGEDDTQFVTVDLSRMSADSIGPCELMRKLVLVMGLDGSSLTSDETAQDARIAEKYCDWMIGQSQKFKQQQKTWLLVLDGLNRPNVTPGALELVDRLSIAAARGELLNMKLLLLALGAPVPAFIVNEVEDHQLLPLGAADLRKYVVALAGVLRRELEPQGIDELTGYVLDTLQPPFGHDGLMGIRQRLRELPKLMAE